MSILEKIFIGVITIIFWGVIILGTYNLLVIGDSPEIKSECIKTDMIVSTRSGWEPVYN